MDMGMGIGMNTSSESSRDQPHLMAELPDLAAPEVGAAASFHRHNAGRELSKKLQHLIPSQLLAQNCAPRDVSVLRLKHSLRQIEPDRDNLRHDRPPLWIIADPPWHKDAVGGRSHHQSRLNPNSDRLGILNIHGSE
jgi:hypothetical protein